MLAGLGVHADLVAFVDGGDLDDEAGFEVAGLTSRGRPLMPGTVSFTTRSTVGGGLMPTGSIVELDADRHLRDQVVFRIPERFGQCGSARSSMSMK